DGGARMPGAPLRLEPVHRLAAWSEHDVGGIHIGAILEVLHRAHGRRSDLRLRRLRWHRSRVVPGARKLARSIVDVHGARVIAPGRRSIRDPLAVLPVGGNPGGAANVAEETFEIALRVAARVPARAETTRPFGPPVRDVDLRRGLDGPSVEGEVGVPSPWAA